MLPLPSVCIWVACHRKKSKSKGEKSCQLATLSLSTSLSPSSFYQLVQVIITLTAFSVFTLSLNLSSRAACCANQLHGAPVTSICSVLLASTLGLTGACRRAAAPPLCQDSYLSQSCQWCDWQPVTGSTHLLLLLPSPCLGLNLPQGSGKADMSSEPQCHAQGISAADDTVTSSAIGCVSSVMTHQKGFWEWC